MDRAASDHLRVDRPEMPVGEQEPTVGILEVGGERCDVEELLELTAGRVPIEFGPLP